MKITYKDKTIEIKENETIQNVLKEEISKSEYPVMRSEEHTSELQSR